MDNELEKVAKKAFGGILGGVLEQFDAVEVIKGVATKATAQLVKGPISELFQDMKVEGRRTLATKLRKLADALWDGHCDDAAEVAADVIDDIKF